MISYEFLYDKQFYLKYIDKKYNKNINLSYVEYNEAYVLPNDGKRHCGVVDSNLNFISSTELYPGFLEGGYNFNNKKITYEDITVIYLGAFLDVWGHWLTDNIKRLWFLKSKIYFEKFKNCKLVYVSYNENFAFSDNVKQLFNLIGIDTSELIRIDKITKFKKIIIPDECLFCNQEEIQIDEKERYYTKEYVDIIDSINNNYSKNTEDNLKSINVYDKLYLSYSKIGAKKQIGEQKLEKFFYEQGYKTIYLEEYSFIEQLKLIKQAKWIATTIGSCSHNIVFANDNTNIVLIPRAAYIGGYQLAINDIVDSKMHIYFIDSTLSALVREKHVAEGPFYYLISNELARFYNQNTKQRQSFDYILYELLASSSHNINLDNKYCKYYEKQCKLNKIFIIKKSKKLKRIFRALTYLLNRVRSQRI